MRPRTLIRLAALAAVTGFAGGWLLLHADAGNELRREKKAEPAGTEVRQRRHVLAVGSCLGLVLLAGSGLLGWKALQKRQEAMAVATALTHGDPARGPALMLRYGCAGCHTIPGVPGADGKVAPSLGGLRERVFVGGVLRNSGDNLVRWIVDPQSVSPRSAMPATGIDEAQARDVAAWLYSH
jgi:mono/diheme cytochrome c family protein